MAEQTEAAYRIVFDRRACALVHDVVAEDTAIALRAHEMTEDLHQDDWGTEVVLLLADSLEDHPSRAFARLLFRGRRRCGPRGPRQTDAIDGPELPCLSGEERAPSPRSCPRG